MNACAFYLWWIKQSVEKSQRHRPLTQVSSLVELRALQMLRVLLSQFSTFRWRSGCFQTGQLYHHFDVSWFLRSTPFPWVHRLYCVCVCVCMCRTFSSLGFPPLSVLIHLLIPQRLEVLHVHRQQGALAWRAAVGAHALHAVPFGFIWANTVQTADAKTWKGRRKEGRWRLNKSSIISVHSGLTAARWGRLCSMPRPTC